MEPMRGDWRLVLSATERAFIEHRTWHTEPLTPRAFAEPKRPS